MHWLPRLDQGWRTQLLRIWCDATNAGGALGFLPPVSADDVAPVAIRLFDRVDAGLDDLLVVTIDDVVVGWLVLERDPRAFAAHWRTLKRLQVDPAHQSAGLGRALLDEARRHAVEELNLEFLLLTVRDGTGVDALYRRAGYRETGRIRGALKVAEHDSRDEIIMRLDLR